MFLFLPVLSYEWEVWKYLVAVVYIVQQILSFFEEYFYAIPGITPWGFGGKNNTSIFYIYQKRKKLTKLGKRYQKISSLLDMLFMMVEKLLIAYFWSLSITIISISEGLSFK